MLVAGKCRVVVIGPCNGVQMAVRELELREQFPLWRWQELVYPRLAYQLCELTLRHGGIEQCPHPLQMAFGIVAYHQLGNLRRQFMRICHPYLFGQSARSHTHIAEHHVLRFNTWA